ncbi:concanavalin A-like lectin/glucanase [Gymnopus androsaceus JB14]|uniref:Concanavalin A-like lectin/glucanase n=1 Tax=Gymnopus androsaceus JB14 TaxID=1447944 RepID=A0A6A4IF49_9AGAR|nr:concanavalin A-like lectin/glucanase [Gymnopus androsaceus JB14]
MFSVSFLVQALLATAAFAIPTNKERMAARRARRGLGRQNQPMSPITSQKATTNFAVEKELTLNWASAVFQVADAVITHKYASLTGTFTIPVITNDGNDVMECAAVWVGIDGATCPTAILQTGMDLAFLEYMNDFPLSVGDSITLTVTISTPTSGIVVITNNSQNVTVSTKVSSSFSDAEWIVEDYGYESPKWGTLTFTDASATTLNGTRVTPGDSGCDEVMTASTFDGDTVSIKYAPAFGGF